MEKFNLEFVNRNNIVLDGVSLKRIRTSGNRLIFKFDKYIIKLDDTENFYTGFQGKDEIDVWKKIKKTIYVDYFVPIIAYGKYAEEKDYDAYWVIQPAITLSRGRRPKWAYEIIDDIMNKFYLYDLGNPENWTISNGLVKIFDYGLVKQEAWD